MIFNLQITQLDAIDQLKQLITTSPLLQFYHPSTQIRLHTDACNDGLGAIIEQQIDNEWHPIGKIPKYS